MVTGTSFGVVSIRSRRLSAGEERLGALQDPRILFRSAPADCRREKRRRPPPELAADQFQSAPLTVGGEDCAVIFQPGFNLLFFNSLPPTVGGRRIRQERGLGLYHVSIRSRRLSAGEGYPLQRGNASALF